MPCCKCIDFGWPFQQDVTYTDEARKKDYCLFHAPAEHKGMSIEDFNEHVFTRINDYSLMIETPEAGEFCDFSGTIFPGEISFKAYGEDNPLPGIDFSEAVFSGRADFGGVKFSGSGYFLEAVFDQNAYFRAATFSRSTGFHAAMFKGTAIFTAATFSDIAVFQVTTFNGKADFRGATFSEGADFKLATFGSVTNFLGVKADKPALRLHSLDSASLANLAFTSMDTECFSFKGCTWPDGGLWPERQNKPDHKACEELYRSLKQKAASEHDQPLVSKWHYREKLMALEQIKAKRGWKARLGLTGLYYWCSGFGEDPAQAFRVLAKLLVVAFLALSGLKLWETGHCWQPAWNKILEIPAEMLALIPFVKTDAKAFSNASGMLAPAKAIVTGLLHILFATQIALFAFALRNRFRR